MKLDFIHTTNAQNLSYSLKVSEFASLTSSESVSRYTAKKRNNVWSGLTHSEELCVLPERCPG